MNFEQLYTADDLYTNRIISVVSEAGLLDSDGLQMVEAYLQETARGEKYV